MHSWEPGQQIPVSAMHSVSVWETLPPVFHLLAHGWLCCSQGSRAVLSLWFLLSIWWRCGGGRLCCKVFLLPLCSALVTALGNLTQRCHKNTESPSSFLYFVIESFIKENRSLNLTSTDLQKAPGVGKWQLFRTVLQMENIKKNHSSTDLSETFWDISTQMPI